MNGGLELELVPPPRVKTLQTRETFPAVKDTPLGSVQVADEAGFAYLDGDIDFGAIGKNEIFQNIKYIVLTEYFSVPLDREFGMDYSMVDKPMAIAEAVLSQEVAMKIALYEPRAQFREISFVRDEMIGKLSPSVKVVLLTTNELPSSLPTGSETSIASVPGGATIEKVDLPAFYEMLVDLAKIPGPAGPVGLPGPIGPQGEAATIEVGTTTTSAPGSTALVENVGNEFDAIFDFTIPRGDVGPQGIQGIQGIQGPQGPQGPPGGIGEAPTDGQQYARKNAAWAIVAVSSPETGATILAKLITVDGTGSNLDADLLDGQNSTFYAPIASPTFTGDPKAPTPSTADNDTSIATTAFVQNVAATKLSATAETRNRFINPAMQISQQNPVGGTSAAAASGSYYAADQWQMQWSTSGSLVCIHGASTPNGSQQGIYYNVQTAAGSQPAGGYMITSQKIEGKMVADCFWGTGSARAVVVRFWMYAQVGNYTFFIRNGAADRSYLASFSIGTASVYLPITIVVPGDTTGTWAKDNTCGIEAGISFAGGSNFLGVAGWQAGNKLNLAGQFNGMGTVGASYAVGDFGFYFDPANTSVAPPWQFPDETRELMVCQRYYEIAGMEGIGFGGNVTSGTNYSYRGRWRVPKRVVPTVTGVNNGNSAFPATIGTLNQDIDGFRETRTANATGAGSFFSTLTGNARM
jgi:hypothetical protein